MDNSAISDDNTRKINKDEPYNSLFAPREEQSLRLSLQNLRQASFCLLMEYTKRPKKGRTLLPMKRMGMPKGPSSTLPLTRMESLQNSW